MNFIFLTLLSLLSVSSYAQAPDALSPECKTQVEHICPTGASFHERIKCLKKIKKFSDECKEELQRYTQINRQAFTRTGGSMGSFGGMNILGPSFPVLSYEGRMLSPPSSETMNENRLNLQLPVYQNQKDRLNLAVSGSKLHINDQIVLSSGKKVPRDLNRVETGLQFSRQLPERRSFGLRSSVGYVGDRIFTEHRNFSYSLMAHYGFPGSEKSMWAVTAFLANNSVFASNIPIPGFLYFYRTETFTGIFGLPFASLQWTPSFPWSYTLSLFGPTINGEVAYGSLDEYQVYFGTAWTRQIYLLSDREDERDRLTIEEKKLQIGVRSPLFWKLISEIQLGRSFDRQIYIGQGFGQKSGGDKNLEAAYFLGWNLKVSF